MLEIVVRYSEENSILSNMNINVFFYMYEIPLYIHINFKYMSMYIHIYIKTKNYKKKCNGYIRKSKIFPKGDTSYFNISS